MHELHIGDFYKDTALILATLYKRFPVKSALYIEDICGPDEPDEFGLHSPRHTSCFSSALWLAEENYIRFKDTIRQEALDECVLTQDAFLCLSTPLPDGQITRIQSLNSIRQTKSSEALNQFMLELMTDFSCKRP
jgi:hypothetical protein